MECFVPKSCVSVCIPCKTKQVFGTLSKQTQPCALYCSKESNCAFKFNGLAEIEYGLHTSVTREDPAGWLLWFLGQILCIVTMSFFTVV